MEQKPPNPPPYMAPPAHMMNPNPNVVQTQPGANVCKFLSPFQLR